MKHYIITFGTLRIYSKELSVLDLIDAIGQPDQSHEAGELRTPSIPESGTHENNGVVFNSKLKTDKSTDDHLLHLLDRVDSEVPEYLRSGNIVQIELDLFIQTSSWHSIKLGEAILQRASRSNVTISISFD